MRPLNRPMFRYGGPIKEGIMDGMRDRKAALVGDPMFPAQGGRGMYSENLIRENLKQLSLFDKIKQAGGQTVSNIAKKPLSVANPFKKAGIVSGFIGRNFGKLKDFGRRQLGKLDMPPKFIPAGSTLGPAYAGVGQRVPNLFEKAKMFARANPKTTIGGAYLSSGPVYDIATGSSPLVKKALLQAADIAVPDFIFDQDKYMENKKIADLNEKIKQNKKTTTVQEKDKGTTTTPQIDRDAEIQANRERYYKILGIDKMKKDAAYDSLIDASKIIQQEGGDLKGAIRSGNLQTQIIDAISKNLDKSADIKRQIDAAIVKAEIDKDVNKDKNTLDRLVKEKQLKVLDRQLEGGSLQEVLADLQSKQGIVPEGPELAALAIRKDIDIPAGHTLNSKDVKTFLKDNPTLNVVDYLNDVNLKLQQEGKGNLSPGNYVVGKNILKVGDDGTVIDVVI